MVNTSSKTAHVLPSHSCRLLSNVKAALGLLMRKWTMNILQRVSASISIKLENSKNVYRLVLLSQDVHCGQARAKKNPLQYRVLNT